MNTLRVSATTMIGDRSKTSEVEASFSDASMVTSILSAALSGLRGAEGAAFASTSVIIGIDTQASPENEAPAPSTLHRAVAAINDGETFASMLDAKALVPRFVDNGDGTVTDTTTGLMWSQDNVGSDRMDWDAAEAACHQLELGGHDDWRLPTRAELLTLVNDTRHDPAIDINAFPRCSSSWYWSATACAWASSYAWIVNFYDGLADYGRRSGYGAFVRAVRSLPAGQ